MKNARFQAFLNDFEYAATACLRTLRRLARHMATQPWPVLLVAAILLAAAISILPLALGLFALFLVVKLAAGALFRRQPPRQLGD